jgi:hypothetical protein
VTYWNDEVKGQYRTFKDLDETRAGGRRNELEGRIKRGASSAAVKTDQYGAV